MKLENNYWIIQNTRTKKYFKDAIEDVASHQQQLTFTKILDEASRFDSKSEAEGIIKYCNLHHCISHEISSVNTTKQVQGFRLYLDPTPEYGSICIDNNQTYSIGDNTTPLTFRDPFKKAILDRYDKLKVGDELIIGDDVYLYEGEGKLLCINKLQGYKCTYAALGIYFFDESQVKLHRHLTNDEIIERKNQLRRLQITSRLNEINLDRIFHRLTHVAKREEKQLTKELQELTRIS